MTPPTYIPSTQTLRAKCRHCDGAVSVFQPIANAVVNVAAQVTRGTNQYGTTAYMLFRCPGCGHGGLAVLYHRGSPADPQSGATYLESFYPFATDAAPLPKDVPEDIQAEFREAELCAAASALRAASALLRSTLEKTLKANGYTTGNLRQKIEQAATDGVITAPRKERAHAEIRVLGNDVLHDEYRVIDAEEVKLAHHYTQRILEDLYDDRPTVLKILVAQKRIPDRSQAQQPAPTVHS